MNPEELRGIAERIREADRLFVDDARFDESLRAARQLLDEIGAVPSPPGGQWRAELLGLAGRSALQLGRTVEARDATTAALQIVHDMRDGSLSPLVEMFRENLLTALAALETPTPTDDDSTPPSHRELRTRIVRAQKLTDRHRFVRSIEILEPLLARLRPQAGDEPTRSEPSGEPADPRLLYLPKILGLLGFNWFHQGERERSRALTEQAIVACRSLGDRSGERVYGASLAWIDAQTAGDPT